MNKKEKGMLDSVKSAILRKFPLLGATMSKLEFEEKTDIQTAATDGEKVFYNPNFIESLSPEQRTFVFSHELMHVAFDHILRSKNKDSKLWNIATDAVINQMLKAENLPIIEGGVDIEEAINKSAEEIYNKLLEEQNKQQQNKNSNGSGKQPQQQENNQQNQQQNNQQQGSNGTQSQQNQQNQGAEQQNNQQQDAGQSSEQQNQQLQANSQNQNQMAQQQHSLWENAVKKYEQQQQSQQNNQNQQQNQGAEQQKQEPQQGSGNQQQNQDSKQQEQNQSQNGEQDSNKEQGEDSNNEPNNNKNQDSTQQQSSTQQNPQKNQNQNNQNQGNQNQQNNKQSTPNKNNLTQKDKIQPNKGSKSSSKGSSQNNESSKQSHTTLEVNESKESEFEKQFSELNKQKKEEIGRQIREKLNQQKQQAVQTLETFGFSNVGFDKPVVSWKKLLKRELEKEEDRWSYRRANEENFYQARIDTLEAYERPETQVLLDTSGSISDSLLRNFLRQLKPLLKESKLYVGCFDDKFYGFTEIKKEKDIETFKLRGRGGTDFNLALKSFSKDKKINKIIFTDGYDEVSNNEYNKKLKNVIWIVYENREFTSCCGKIIQINKKDINLINNFDKDTENLF